MFAKFLKDESGATIIEYTLLAALIGVALIGTMEALTTAIDGNLKGVQSKLKAKTPS